jgi:DNA-3-methyladenine glycosylase II
MENKRSRILRATPPFELRRSLDFLAGFPPLRGEQQIVGGRLRKALRVAGRTLLCEVEAAPEPAALRCTLSADAPIDEALATTAFERVRGFLSLDDELEPLYARAAADRPFAAVISELHGYHQVKFPTPFEAAAWSVLGQRCPMAVAHTLKLRLAERSSSPIRRHGQRFTPFPEAGELPDEAALADLLASRVKARRVAAVARAFADVAPSFLACASTDEVEAWLREIDGIGPWTSTFVLIRGLGRMERVPPDGMLAEVFSARYGVGAELGEVAARYGSAQGYWAHYLRAVGTPC